MESKSENGSKAGITLPANDITLHWSQITLNYLQITLHSLYCLRITLQALHSLHCLTIEQKRGV